MADTIDIEFVEVNDIETGANGVHCTFEIIEDNEDEEAEILANNGLMDMIRSGEEDQRAGRMVPGDQLRRGNKGNGV